MKCVLYPRHSIVFFSVFYTIVIPLLVYGLFAVEKASEVLSILILMVLLFFALRQIVIRRRIEMKPQSVIQKRNTIHITDISGLKYQPEQPSRNLLKSRHNLLEVKMKTGQTINLDLGGFTFSQVNQILSALNTNEDIEESSSEARAQVKKDYKIGPKIFGFLLILALAWILWGI